MEETSRNIGLRSALLFGALTLGSCVTINIYFPAAAAERAADRIIDEVWQLKPDASKPRAEKPAAAPKENP